MTDEAHALELALDRIGQRSLDQVREISDEDLNRPLDLPESNSAFVLATHLIGAAEYWVLELAGGQDVARDRPAEFRATGTGAALAARYERWLAAMHTVLAALPGERMGQPALAHDGQQARQGGQPVTVRDALLHAIEHCALHQGHLELTRQLLGYPPAGAQ